MFSVLSCHFSGTPVSASVSLQLVEDRQTSLIGPITDSDDSICDDLIDCLVAVANEGDHDAALSIAHFILREDFVNWDDGYRGNFLRNIAPAVLISAAKYNIPPSVIFGQAILESGWGRARLAKQYIYLFGIKGRGPNSLLYEHLKRALTMYAFHE